MLQPVWAGPGALATLHRPGATFVQAATPFLADLVDAVDRGGPRHRSLRVFVATGAAVPRTLAERATRTLGAAVCGAWGTTESCLGTLAAPTDEPARAWGTDGRALRDIRLRVTDDDGTVLPAGTEGNFEVRSPTLFDGYLDRPDQTAAALTPDGWYRSGDLAVIDDAGFVRITGRVKDVINRGGEKIPVAEIEQLLHTHPAVPEVAIVAMPDPRLGERACAFVVAGPGFAFAAMRRFLDAQQVAKQYWPERLELVDELPRNVVGKVQKFVLRDRIRDLSEEDPAPGRSRVRLAQRDRGVRARAGRGVRRGDRAHPRGPGRAVGRPAGPGLPAPGRPAGVRRPRPPLLPVPGALELFSMSHASLRMIVHVCNGIWRAMDQFATDEQRKPFVLPQVAGDLRVAFTLTEPTAGTGADLRARWSATATPTCCPARST